MIQESKRPIDWYDIAIDALTEEESKSLLRLLYSTNIHYQAVLVGVTKKKLRDPAEARDTPVSKADTELSELIGEGRAIG